jgi:tetratricopeptide (TPR) repeat protein
MKGRLSEGLLPSLLRELYVGRETGLLSLARLEERRGVRFRHGHLIGADTNVREERMGELMVRHGILSAADLKRATGFVLRDKKKLGTVLLELGILDHTGLEDAMGLHVREILSRVFDWKDGEYEFQPEPDVPFGPTDVVLKLSTAELILEAARSVQDPDIIRYCIGNLDRAVALSMDPLLRFQKLALTATDGYVLSRIDGTLSARELQLIIPLPPDETVKSLFGLLSTGVVELVPGPPKKRAAPPPLAAAPARPPASTPASAPEEVFKFVVAPPAAAPAEPGTATALPSAGREAVVRLAPEEPEPETDPRRLEILEAHQDLKTKNHFEVLGLTRGATEAQVKEAYFRMAKRFHPDVHHSAGLSDLREQIEAVFIRLGLAYEVLRNPRTRANYESELPRPSGPASLPKAETPSDPEEERKRAEESVRKAERAMAAEKYWEAIQLLESALGRVQGKVRLKGRVLLARAYARNPNWIKQAEEELLAVLREDPAHLEAYVLLGAIYRDGGLKARALSMYRKALDLAPDNQEALAQASLLSTSEAEPEKKGVFKKLFGRS